MPAVQLVLLPENGIPGLLRRAPRCAAVTTATNNPQPAPRRVRPHQAVPLARRLPAGSVMVGDVANSGAKGAGRELLAAVCAQADRRDWNLALGVRNDRPKVVTLYGLMFIPLGAQRSQRIMGRRRQP